MVASRRSRRIDGAAPMPWVEELSHSDLSRIGRAERYPRRRRAVNPGGSQGRRAIRMPRSWRCPMGRRLSSRCRSAKSWASARSFFSSVLWEAGVNRPVRKIFASWLRSKALSRNSSSTCSSTKRSMGPPGSQRKSGATAILNLPPLRAGAAGGGWLGGLEGLEHEVEQMVPGVKRQVLCQGTEVFEEVAPRGELPAYGLVALIEALERGMGEKRQERQSGSRGRRRDAVCRGRSCARSGSPGS